MTILDVLNSAWAANEQASQADKTPSMSLQDEDDNEDQDFEIIEVTPDEAGSLAAGGKRLGKQEKDARETEVVSLISSPRRRGPARAVKRREAQSEDERAHEHEQSDDEDVEEALVPTQPLSDYGEEEEDGGGGVADEGEGEEDEEEEEDLLNWRAPWLQGAAQESSASGSAAPRPVLAVFSGRKKARVSKWDLASEDEESDGAEQNDEEEDDDDDDDDDECHDLADSGSDHGRPKNLVWEEVHEPESEEEDQEDADSASDRDMPQALRSIPRARAKAKAKPRANKRPANRRAEAGKAVAAAGGGGGDTDGDDANDDNDGDASSNCNDASSPRARKRLIARAAREEQAQVRRVDALWRKINTQILRGAHCKKELLVVMDKAYAESPAGCRVQWELLESKFPQPAAEEFAIKGAIFFRRRKLTADVVDVKTESPGFDLGDERGRLENLCLLVWPGQDFVERLGRVQGSDYDDFLGVVHLVRGEWARLAATDPEPARDGADQGDAASSGRARLIVILEGASDAVTAAQRANRALSKENPAGLPPSADLQCPDGVDNARAWLYMAEGLSVHHSTSVDDTARMVCGFAQSLATRPYRKVFTNLDVAVRYKSFSATNDLLASASSSSSSSSAGHGSVAALGNGLRRSNSRVDGHQLEQIWVNQLRCIPRISEAKALKIVQRYPTFRSLYEAYQRTDLTEDQKDELLQDVMDDGNRQQRKLSRLVRLYLTSKDPAVNIV